MGLTRPTDLADVIPAIGQMADALERTPTWRYVADIGYQNTWADVGTGLVRARFYKDATGVVHMSGVVQRNPLPAGAETIFTLPVGYRTARAGGTLRFLVSGTANPPLTAQIATDSSGIVQFESVVAGAIAPLQLQLVQISFKAEL